MAGSLFSLSATRFATVVNLSYIRRDQTGRYVFVIYR